MIYLLTAADSTATDGTEGFSNTIISRMSLHLQHKLQATQMWSDLGKQLFCLSPFGYTNNPLNMGTIVTSSMICKTALKYRVNCTNGLCKNRASNRDTTETYLRTEARVRNLFPPFSHWPVFNCTQSLTVRHPQCSSVCLCSIQCQQYLSSTSWGPNTGLHTEDTKMSKALLLNLQGSNL